MKRPLPAGSAIPLLLLLAASLPVIAWGVRQGFQEANNNIAQWLPEGYPETVEYAEFRERFGSEEFALVTWSGCTLDEPLLEKLARRLEGRGVNGEGGEGEGGEGEDASRWFDEVRTGPELIRILLDEPFELTEREALERLEGTLIGPPPAEITPSPSGRITGALVTFSPAGHGNRTAAVTTLRDIASEVTGLPLEEIHLGGDAVTNAAIDVESERAVRTWIGLSWLIALVVAWLCLRSFKLVVMVFVVSGYSAALGSAMIYYTGATMNLVLVVVPVLVYVLTLSASVHLANYYRDAVRQAGVDGAAMRALRAGWLPALMSAGTTSLGLISLVVSHLRPVQQFGIFSALGTMIGLGILVLVLPALLDRWPPVGRTEQKGETPPRASAARVAAHVIIRYRTPVLVVGTTLFLALAIGVGFIETTVAPGRFFDESSPWVEDGKWIQKHLGPIVPLEVTLEFPRQPDNAGANDEGDNRGGENREANIEDGKRNGEPSYSLTPLARLELTDRIARLIRRHESIGGTLSAATFGPRLEELGGGRDWLARSVWNRRLRENMRLFERMDFVRRTDDAEYWRISARVPGFSDIDHDLLLDEIEKDVDAYLDRAGLTREQVRPSYTGIVPLVFVAQRELLNGLINSFLLAFGLIAVVMIILLRDLLAGAVAMLPNVFPAVTVFGVMGWSGTLVDVGAMMTASVALGIAVDDTVHFLTWFRRARSEGRSRRAAVVDAYERCAVAMTQTTLIAGLGLIVFAQSDFLPVSQFGLLMFILLVAALVGDLLLLPAILATRLGEGFSHR